MTVFLILATALVAGAMLLVIPPLLGIGRSHARAKQEHQQAETALVVLREQLAELESEYAAGNIDEADYNRSRNELEQRALEEGEAAESRPDLSPSPVWAAAAALSVPVLAVGVYLALGEPGGLDPVQTAAPEGSHEITPEQIAQMVAQLANRLEREPNNPEGWVMLARSYSMMQDYQTAMATYERLAPLMPKDPDVLADWADLVAGAQGRKIAGEAERLVQQALELDPNHVKALALAGTAAFQREEFAEASAYWERILTQIPPTENFARSIRASINEARAKGGLPPLQDAPMAQNGSGPPAAVAEQGSLTVTGRVSLAAEVAERASPDDTVYVFARPAQGGIPLAALRLRVGDLPASFDFRNAQRMSDGPVPDQISVAARVSKQGDATPRAGDLEGRSATVSPDAADVSLVIDRVRE